MCVSEWYVCCVCSCLFVCVCVYLCLCLTVCVYDRLFVCVCLSGVCDVCLRVNLYHVCVVCVNVPADAYAECVFQCLCLLGET